GTVPVVLIWIHAARLCPGYRFVALRGSVSAVAAESCSANAGLAEVRDTIENVPAEISDDANSLSVHAAMVADAPNPSTSAPMSSARARINVRRRCVIRARRERRV